MRLYFYLNGIRVGRNLTCFGIPNVEIGQGAKLEFGENVIIREGVDLRVKSGCKLVFQDNVKLDTHVRVVVANESEVFVSRGVEIGCFTIINAGANVQIGSDTLIGGFVYIQTSNHGLKKSTKIKSQPHVHSEILIGEDVWIGGGVFLAPGAMVQSGVVIGANSLLNKSTSVFGIYAGSPAKLIGARN